MSRLHELTDDDYAIFLSLPALQEPLLERCKDKMQYESPSVVVEFTIW